ncbi:polysaccharide pyruvyl transferase family protein [Microbacterium sp. Root553]|uniref:polysaccharide pyruvyl transferase family protein n=1 Tax=Microbacterium sp. Root553 TaxID=1736556 RepID=UPI0006FB8755|nr:polysaccharide pyruvyl transferase family protein [Microbacterium sp. Root553]KQZ22524.1 hypothetical protein ASD43_14535 [Microbacterium sp. Root553]
MRILVISSDRTSELNRPVNLGDAMLTDALVASLRAKGHDAIAADFGDSARTGGEARLRLSGVGALLRALRDVDALVIGGGTLLQDDAREIPGGWGGLPRLCAASSVLARLTRTKVAFYGVGCDPVERAGARTLLRLAVRGVPVWVRDTRSAARVRETLKGTAMLGADASLLMGFDPRGQAADDAPVVVALNGEHARHLTAGQVEALKRPGRRLVFLNMSQGGSFLDADSLSVEARAAFDEVTEPMGWDEAFRLIRSAESVWGSRMHALYAAMLSGVPMVALSALPKVVTFAEDFGIARVTETSEIGDVHPTLADTAALDAAVVTADRTLDDLLVGFVGTGR